MMKPAKTGRRRYLRMTLTIAAVTMLSGCGGEDSGGGTAAPADNVGGAAGAAPTPTPAPAPAPTATPATPDAQTIAQVLTIDIDNLLNYENPVLPAYYDNTVFRNDNAPNNNQTDDARATLGRVLFYDVSLSVNDQVACATCHQQGLGFDDDTRFSGGVAPPQVTGAHAMRLGNVRFYGPGDMFWNKRANSVEAQASGPITNPVEMGWDNAAGGINALITKLQGKAYYPILFNLAFGSPTITENRIQQAVANFERAMISSDSRWDRAYAQVFNPNAQNRNLNINLAGFSASEQLGRQLFMGGRNNGGAGCAACHEPPTFALVGNSRSNGLDAGETTIFKSPSLKNIARSQFFMHDGRFTTLMQVVQHYDTGIQDGPALDNRLRQGNGPQRLNLNATERQALVDFLETLNDDTLDADPRFTDPFR